MARVNFQKLAYGELGSEWGSFAGDKAPITPTQGRVVKAPIRKPVVTGAASSKQPMTTNVAPTRQPMVSTQSSQTGAGANRSMPGVGPYTPTMGPQPKAPAPAVQSAPIPPNGSSNVIQMTPKTQEHIFAEMNAGRMKGIGGGRYVEVDPSKSKLSPGTAYAGSVDAQGRDRGKYYNVKDPHADLAATSDVKLTPEQEKTLSSMSPTAIHNTMKSMNENPNDPANPEKVRMIEASYDKALVAAAQKYPGGERITDPTSAHRFMNQMASRDPNAQKFVKNYSAGKDFVRSHREYATGNATNARNTAAQGHAELGQQIANLRAGRSMY